MCVKCIDESDTAAEALPDRHLMEMTAREHLAGVLELNAAKINPDPVCRDCGYIHHHGERGEVFRDCCASCQTNRLEDLVFDVAFAKSKKSARKALKRLSRKVRRAARK